MNRLLTTFLMTIAAIAASAQSAAPRPKLVVSIVVDQLRTDYIEYLKAMFGEKGFKRLIKNGAYLRNVDFRPAHLDAVSSTAMLYTGNYPDNTGVPMARYFDRTSGRTRAALHDEKALGNFTADTYSPRNLALSTFTDELMIDGAGLGLAYAIATDPQQAVVMAGHAATGAAWLDPHTGKWASSTYYKDMPRAISSRNYNRPLSQRLDTMSWRPSRPLASYPGLPAQKQYYEFRYTFPSSAADRYVRFAASPLANDEVTSIAIDCLKSDNMGRRGNAVDMLNVAYTAAPFKYVKDGDFRLELQDTYLRLDSQIGRLLDAIDSQVGLQNAVILLSSTGYYDDATADDAKYQIPTGDFSAKRAVSLLNAFFMAKYGNADYVDFYGDRQFYLSRKAFESKGVDMAEAANQAKTFLAKMTGVANAYTLSDLLNASDSRMQSLRLSFSPSLAGDVMIEVLPGWNLVDDTVYPPQTRQVRSSMVASPVFIMAPAVLPQTIDTPVDAAAIAPTLTQILRIRSPNGAVMRPLPLF